MIDELMINKFSDIEDLPVSEEMLGAYLEGNLDSYEMNDVLNAIQDNPMLLEIMEDVTTDDTFYITDSDIEDILNLEDESSSNFTVEDEADFADLSDDPDLDFDETDWDASEGESEEFGLGDDNDNYEIDMPDIPDLPDMPDFPLF